MNDGNTKIVTVLTGIIRVLVQSIPYEQLMDIATATMASVEKINRLLEDARNDLLELETQEEAYGILDQIMRSVLANYDRTAVPNLEGATNGQAEE